MKSRILVTPLVISLLLCIYVLACQPQIYTPATYTGRQLIFGNGGGFTGAETTYILLENGQLFSSGNQSQEPQFIKSLSKNIIKKLFEKFRQGQLTNTSFHHPGNIYYFIGIKDSNHSQRIVWGHTNYQVPGEAEELYQLLMVNIKN